MTVSDSSVEESIDHPIRNFGQSTHTTMRFTINEKTVRRSCGLLFMLALCSCPSLLGQTAIKPEESSADKLSEKDGVALSRFVVTTDEDDGYRATSTLAGTRLKTELRDLGSSISVVTAEFLRDTASKNSEDLLLYTLGTEVGGLRGNFGGVGDGATPSEAGALLRPNNLTRVRGLSAADNARDFFLTDIPWDAYIVDRVDLQRGPNAILFGLGKPGGIINATTDQATFRNAYSVQTRVGSFGSYRGAIDFNQVIPGRAGAYAPTPPQTRTSAINASGSSGRVVAKRGRTISIGGGGRCGQGARVASGSVLPEAATTVHLHWPPDCGV